MGTTTHFEVRRDDLYTTRITSEPRPEPEDGQVVVEVDQFGFTANNITYAAFGDMLGYWQFFPSDGPWGRVPVWGYADVVASRHDQVREGARIYGYLPMSTHLVLQPDRADERTFLDASPHRQALPPTYNQYTLTAGDPSYDPSRERERMLLWPLFFTSFLIDDFLGDHGFWSAEAVVLSSASSKTAIGTAFLLAKRDGIDVIGLTSERNEAFVERLGCYDRVVRYADIGKIVKRPSIFVDMAGDANVRHAVHDRLQDALVHSSLVGGTHWDVGAGDVGDDELPGPAPAFFFAPDQIRARAASSGQQVLDDEVNATWAEYLAFVDDWFTIDEHRGADAVATVYGEVLRGEADPARGLVLSMHA